MSLICVTTVGFDLLRDLASLVFTHMLLLLLLLGLIEAAWSAAGVTPESFDSAAPLHTVFRGGQKFRVGSTATRSFVTCNNDLLSLYYVLTLHRSWSFACILLNNDGEKGPRVAVELR